MEQDEIDVLAQRLAKIEKEIELLEEHGFGDKYGNYVKLDKCRMAGLEAERKALLQEVEDAEIVG